MEHSAPRSRSNTSVDFFTCVYALRAPLACPQHPSNIEIVSQTFAAVICDAEAPRSVDTATARVITNNVASGYNSTFVILEFLVWFSIFAMTLVHLCREVC